MRKKNVEMDTHHRVPKVRGGKGGSNTIRVRRVLHIAYNQLFSTLDPEGVAKVLNETWIDPHYKLVAIPRKVN